MRKRKFGKKLAKRIFFYLFITLLFLFLSFKTYQAFKSSRWRGKENFNLVIDAPEDFYLLVIRPQDSTLKILVIPENTYLEVPPEYGQYVLKNVYLLGEQEFGHGGQLLTFTLSDFLGAPVTGWLKVKQKIEPSRRHLLMAVLKNIFVRKDKTNLNLVDSLRLALILSNLRRTSHDLVFLKNSGVLSETIRADGKQILQANSLLLDDLLTGFLEEEDLREERRRVAVFNASSFKDLAAKVGRVLKNLGCQVVMVDNLPCVNPPCFKKESELLYRDEEVTGSVTFKKIKDLYSFKTRQGVMEGAKVDLALILGENFWLALQGKRGYSDSSGP